MHLESSRPPLAAGRLLIGEAILDDAGEMIGYCTNTEFSDRAGPDAWLASDPYVPGKLCQRIEIRPFRVAARVTA